MKAYHGVNAPISYFFNGFGLISQRRLDLNDLIIVLSPIHNLVCYP